MNRKDFEIKQGIKTHLIQTDLFKTNVISGMITVPLTRQNVTKNALIVSMLRRGTANLPTQMEISKKLESLYGSGFECGVDKYGDNQILRFYMDVIDNDLALEKEDILKETIEILLDIMFNPILENGKFKQEYLEVEKENLARIIKSKIDNKDLYAYETCISKMYGENGFGLYKYGYLEDLEKINCDNLTEYYNNFIQNCKIDFFVSGHFDEKNVLESIQNNENIQKLRPRIENYILNNEFTEKKETVENVNVVTENMDVMQGKLVIGMNVNSQTEDLQYKAMMYNILLRQYSNFFTISECKRKRIFSIFNSQFVCKAKIQYFYSCWD